RLSHPPGGDGPVGSASHRLGLEDQAPQHPLGRRLRALARNSARRALRLRRASLNMTVTAQTALAAGLDSRRTDWSWLASAGAIVLVAWLVLVPLIFMVWQSMLSPQTAATAARFTLDNFRRAYASADTPRLFVNSLQFALGS